MRRQREHPPDRSASTTPGLEAGLGRAAPAPRGRGASINPASRFETISLAQLPAGGGDDDLLHEEEETHGERRVATVVYHDRTRTLINRVDSPDLPFAWTINPYRGCEHGCIYCYARPTHELLGLSCGLDFETRLFAKADAPSLLRRELARRSWAGEPIVMSGVTDPYQPVERRLRITRGCLEVMAACGQPVSIVTKSALVLRDLDLLSRLASFGAARVFVSLTTLDPRLSSEMEPRAASPALRLRAVRELAGAGVPVSVMTAPIIPGLNDRELPALLRAAAEAGATGAGYVMLRLPWQNKALFERWLRGRFPARAAHILALVRGVRGGRLNDPGWGSRFRGEGAFAEQVRASFRVFARRFGLDKAGPALSSACFQRPDPGAGAGQLGLFSGDP